MCVSEFYCFFTLFTRFTAKWHMEKRIQQTGNERQRNVIGNVKRLPRYVFGQQPTFAQSRGAKQSLETKVAGRES